MPGRRFSEADQTRADRYYASHLLGELKDLRAVDRLTPLLAQGSPVSAGRGFMPALDSRVSTEEVMKRAFMLGLLTLVAGTPAGLEVSAAGRQRAPQPQVAAPAHARKTVQTWSDGTKWSPRKTC